MGHVCKGSGTPIPRGGAPMRPTYVHTLCGRMTKVGVVTSTGEGCILYGSGTSLLIAQGIMFFGQ